MNEPRPLFSAHILYHHVGMSRALQFSHTWEEDRQVARDKAKNQRQLILETIMDYLLVLKKKLRRPRIQIARQQRIPIKLHRITFCAESIVFYLTLVLDGVSVTIIAVFCSEVQSHH